MRGQNQTNALRAASAIACATALLATPHNAAARTATIELVVPDREIDFPPVLNASGQVAYFRSEEVVICGIGFDCPGQWIRRGQEGVAPITIAAQTDPVPGGVFTPTILSLTPDDTSSKGLGPRITDSGTVMFHATLKGSFVNASNDAGIYSSNGGANGEVAREGSASPTGAAYTHFEAMAINNIGEQAFIADLSGVSSPEGIFRRQGGAVTVVQTGNPAPVPVPLMDYDLFGSDSATNTRGIAINNNATHSLNQVAFNALLDAAIGDDEFDTGIFRSRKTLTPPVPGEAPTTLIKRENANTPGGVTLFGQPVINENAFTAYYASLNGSPSQGIFLADATTPAANVAHLARTGDTVPGGSNTYDGFGRRPALNNLDWVAFKATFSFSDGSGQSEGIYRASLGGADTTIAQALQAAVVHGEDDRFFTGKFDDNVAINNKNITAFSAETVNAVFFGGDPQEGIYIGFGSGKPALEVVRTGQILDGGTVVSFKANLEPNQGGNTALNDAGQVAFQATFAGGNTGVYLYTPPLKSHFTTATSYAWTDASDWQLNFVPPDDDATFLPDPSIYDIFVGDDADKLPASPATVSSPNATTTVKSLTIGEQGVGPGPSPAITLQVDHIPAETNPTLTVNEPLTIFPIGKLTISGPGAAGPVVVAAMDTLTNHGDIELTADGHLGGPATLDNHGTVTGDGTIANRLLNMPTGELVVGDTDTIHFTHTGDAHESEGTIGVSIGATLVFDEDLLTTTGSTTAIEGGTLTVPGDAIPNSMGMTNNGHLQLLQATINGDLRSPTGSTIEVTDFATFNGLVSGAADIDGEGTVNFNGGYDPGDSPAEVNISGAVVLGPANVMTLEVLAPTPTDSDPVPGVDHDQVNIKGSASLNGTLIIDLLKSENRPELGTRYPVMTYDTRIISATHTMFTTIDGALIDTQLALAPLFISTSMATTDDDTLILRATIPGDLNLDNRVSVADLSTFALNFNTSPGLGNWELGDFNTDGDVTVADLSLLALNFGFDLSAATPATGLSLEAAASLAGINISDIPEPTTMTLLITLCAAHRPRRKQPNS